MPAPQIKFNSWALAVAKFFDWLKGERDPEVARRRRRLDALTEIHRITAKRRGLEDEIMHETDAKRKKVLEDRLTGYLLTIQRLRDEIEQLEAR